MLAWVVRSDRKLIKTIFANCYTKICRFGSLHSFRSLHLLAFYFSPFLKTRELPRVHLWRRTYRQRTLHFRRVDTQMFFRQSCGWTGKTKHILNIKSFSKTKHVLGHDRRIKGLSVSRTPRGILNLELLWRHKFNCLLKFKYSRHKTKLEH